MQYQMRQKMLSIGDDFWVEDGDGEKVFKVNGKAMRVRKTFLLETPDGDEVLKIQERRMRLRGTMKIERDGDTLATVKKAVVDPVRSRFTIDVEGGDDLQAQGNIVDHEYEIERDGRKIAEISKRWFRVRDTYGVEVAPGENDALIIAATVCIDAMVRD
jgi:uncharacterized protein YxjI